MHSIAVMTLIHALKANVVVNEFGRAALCDFGLSHLSGVMQDGEIDDCLPSRPFTTGLTSTVIGGTLRYLAPEQSITDGRPTTCSDVYAFGCTCAEVCL